MNIKIIYEKRNFLSAIPAAAERDHRELCISQCYSERSRTVSRQKDKDGISRSDTFSEAVIYRRSTGPANVCANRDCISAIVIPACCSSVPEETSQAECNSHRPMQSVSRTGTAARLRRARTAIFSHSEHFGAWWYLRAAITRDTPPNSGRPWRIGPAVSIFFFSFLLLDIISLHVQCGRIPRELYVRGIYTSGTELCVSQRMVYCANSALPV